jgi:5'-nucleotidase
MKLQRRLFLSQLSVAAAAVAISKPMKAAASIGKVLGNYPPTPNSVTLFHTGNLRGNIGPAVKGGSGLRSVSSFLANHESTGLLLDSGNFLGDSNSGSQNYALVASMNKTGYLAAGIGEQEFSAGQDALARLIPFMNFRMVNCNYRFDNALSGLVAPYAITYSGKIKIGITGVGGRISGVGFNDPSACANQVARQLKEKEKCDLVICLSSLRFSEDNGMPDNKTLAKRSEHIDFIIGESSNTPAIYPLVLLNKNKQEVLISQAASNGYGIGKISCSFLNGKQKSHLKAKSFVLSEAGTPVV